MFHLAPTTSTVFTLGTTAPAWLSQELAWRPVLLATDADEAGDKAAVKLTREFTSLGARVWRWRPSARKDWNEELMLGGLPLLRQSCAAFAEMADEAAQLWAVQQQIAAGQRPAAEFIAWLLEDAELRAQALAIIYGVA